MRQVSGVYETMLTHLGRHAFECDHVDDPKHARVNMYHAEVDNANKTAIIAGLSSTDNPLKIVVCTSALALGVDTKGVEFVLHVAPPVRLADFIQQFGRAGRESHMKLCASLLFYTPTSMKDVDSKMREYCFLKTCRRQFLFENLCPGRTFKPIIGRPCCDNCLQRITSSSFGC